jgi:hypothetical protein
MLFPFQTSAALRKAKDKTMERLRNTRRSLGDMKSKLIAKLKLLSDLKNGWI